MLQLRWSRSSFIHAFRHDGHDPPAADRMRTVAILSAQPILAILTESVTTRVI